MVDKEVPRQIQSNNPYKEKRFSSKEGLITSTGSDYDFHKDVIDSCIVPFVEIATSQLLRIAESILYARIKATNEDYINRISYYANRVQSIYFRAAASIMLITQSLTTEDIEALEKMGIMERRNDSLHFVSDGEYCTQCYIPLLNIPSENKKLICSSCQFFSTLKPPKDGIID